MKIESDAIIRTTREYDKPDTRELARLSSIQEGECYEWTPEGRKANNTRIEELIGFSRKCNYKRLGLVFCIGLANEASVLTDILESKGFDIISVCCKVGSLPKESIGITQAQKIGGADSRECMCNPITQAEIMHSQNVDLAVMLGLCIGHDTLLIKHCKVPLTVLAVKDRVTGHNPLAPLYTAGSYYSRLLAKDTPSSDQDE
ncbi:MAG: DUF1847 domain-containing protein [Chloroflexota bacterium]|nr:DUF1847 domain-containing protein [Chloroflexota bacterium]